MPIQHAIWTVDNVPIPLRVGRLPNEQTLEDMIVRDPRILSSEWMLVGRQEATTHGGRVDLLAIAPDGSLVLVELKRDRTPREIIAQALDYASWVESLGAEKIAQIYQCFTSRSLGEDFRQRFGAELDEETLNQSHQIVIVAAELDGATERIISYLNARGIAINVLSFKVFQYREELLLSRAWLIDPGETQSNVAATAASRGGKEPWNGEYYVSFGPPTSRNWDDARQYGYISAGGGNWYSRTLRLLVPGDRVWVKIPQTGYVGVGRVTEAMVPIREFKVHTDAGECPALEALSHANHLYAANADDPEMAEYFVRVAWLATVSEPEAINEVGMFGNTNTVCRPTTPKWRHTVERLKTHFQDWDRQA